MKKISLLVVSFLLFGSVAFASPLMDFSAGKGSLDLTWRNTQNTAFGSDYDSKYNFDVGLTFGLGNNFALQYRNFQPKSDDTDFSGATENFKLETNEFNVLYKLDKNVAAFAGFLNAKGVWNSSLYGNYSSDSKNYFQIGVVASTPIAERTNLWGSLGFGSNLTNYGIGIGYEFSPNWEFNVDYRSIETKHLHDSGGSYDAKAKGLGLGVSYKF